VLVIQIYPRTRCLSPTQCKNSHYNLLQQGIFLKMEYILITCHINSEEAILHQLIFQNSAFIICHLQHFYICSNFHFIQVRFSSDDSLLPFIMCIALQVVLKLHVSYVLKPLHFAVYIIFLPYVSPVISVLLPHRFFVMPHLLSSAVLLIYLCHLKCSLCTYFILFSTSLFIVTWNLIFYAHFHKL